MKIKKIIILGNKGFIGNGLETFLHKNITDIDVIGLDMPEYDLSSSCCIKKLKNIFDSDSVVIFLASRKRQFGDDLNSFKYNLSITNNVCEALINKQVKRLIYFSSAAVYGEDIHNVNITEETPVNPTSYYGISKYSSECLLQKVCNNLLLLRPATIYGYGDKGDTYGPVRFLNRAFNERKLITWGDGKELREFIYIDDLIKLLKILIFSHINGVLNIASGRSYSFSDSLNFVKRITSKQIEIESKLRTKTKVDNIFLNSKLQKKCDDFKFTDLETGIESMYNKLLFENKE